MVVVSKLSEALRLRPTAWRPSKALRKRRANYLSLLDASGVAAVLFFFVGMYLVMSATPVHSLAAIVDLAAVGHPQPEPGALREDAIIVIVTREGKAYFGSARVVPKDLPDLIREAYVQGGKRKVYFKADARAKYGDVQAVFDLICKAGVQHVVFLVEQSVPQTPASSNK